MHSCCGRHPTINGEHNSRDAQRYCRGLWSLCIHYTPHPLNPKLFPFTTTTIIIIALGTNWSFYHVPWQRPHFHTEQAKRTCSSLVFHLCRPTYVPIQGMCSGHVWHHRKVNNGSADDATGILGHYFPWGGLNSYCKIDKISFVYQRNH